MKRMKMFSWSLVPLLFLLLAACGGGGGSSSTTVSGVAAAGSPVAGTVSLKDASVPAKELSVPINADGSFSFSLDGLIPPYILKASGTANHAPVTLYSLSQSGGIANINPLSSLAVALAHNSDNLSSLYNAPDPLTLRDVSHALKGAISDVQTALRPTLEKFGAAHVDFITDPYVANHQGLDLLLDLAEISMGNGLVTMGDGMGSQRVQPLARFNMDSYDVIASPLTTPGTLCIMPRVSTVMAGGSMHFSAFVIGSQNGEFSWSVVEDGGGSITADGLYTAPLHAGSYHVRATSMADPGKSGTVPVTVREPENILRIVSSVPGEYTLMGENLVKINGAEIEIAYDSTTLANPMITQGALAAGTMFVANPRFRPDGVKLAFMSLTPISGGGPLATIRFDLKGGVPGQVRITRTILVSDKPASIITETPLVPPAVPPPGGGTGGDAGSLTAVPGTAVLAGGS